MVWLVSKCNQIRRKLRIWSHLRKKSLIENVSFCAVFTRIRDILFLIKADFAYN